MEEISGFGNGGVVVPFLSTMTSVFGLQLSAKQREKPLGLMVVPVKTPI